MRSLLRLSLFLTALVLPLAALATPPPVTGLRASYENGQVHVSWNAPADPGSVSYYHLYYSHESILQNSGAYDDFETTSGTRTDFILTKIPKGATVLFIAVLAVGNDGQEANVFSDEVPVSVSPDGVLPPQPEPSATGETLVLQSAQGISHTDVLLTFSLPVKLDANRLDAFHIEDEAGHALSIVGLHSSDNLVGIETAPQTDGMTYTVRAEAFLTGTGTAGDMPLDPLHDSATFTGQAAPAASVAPVTQDAVERPDVSNLELQSVPQDNGLYTVVAAWDVIGETAALQSLRVRQTTDDGRTYGQEQQIPAGTRFLRLRDIAPGQFGILLDAVATDGQASRGSLASIALAPTAASQHGLPHSGPGALLIFGASGVAVGWIWIRKRLLPA